MKFSQVIFSIFRESRCPCQVLRKKKSILYICKRILLIESAPFSLSPPGGGEKRFLVSLAGGKLNFLFQEKQEDSAGTSFLPCFVLTINSGLLM